MDANTFLMALLEATEHYEGHPRYARWDGAFISFTNAEGLKPGLIGAAGDERIRVALIDDLVDAGMLRALPAQSAAAVERKFSLTSEGRRRAREFSASTSWGSDAVDLSWSTLRARLAAFVDDYERAGAPPQGLRFDPSAGDAIHLETLLRTGYLEETVYATDDVPMLQPTERALAVTRAWPSALVLADAIVDDVVDELARRPEQNAGGMRASLIAGGRDLLVEVVAAAIAKESGIV